MIAPEHSEQDRENQNSADVPNKLTLLRRATRLTTATFDRHLRNHQQQHHGEREVPSAERRQRMLCVHIQAAADRDDFTGDERCVFGGKEGY